MSEKVWVLSVGELFEGQYVVSVFNTKPSVEILKKIIPKCNIEELLREHRTLIESLDKFAELEEFEVKPGE